MDPSTVKRMAVAWRANMNEVYSKVYDSNASSWDMMFANSYNVAAAHAATVPKPTTIAADTCAAILTYECSTASPLKLVGEQCCCATAHCPGACPPGCPRLRDQPLFFGLNYSSKTALSNRDTAVRFPELEHDIAKFLLVRGKFAWLGECTTNVRQVAEKVHLLCCSP